MIRVDVRVKPMAPPDIEVAFVHVDRRQGGRNPVYMVECEYAGIFRAAFPRNMSCPHHDRGAAPAGAR